MKKIIKIISAILVLCTSLSMHVGANFSDISGSDTDEKAVFDVYSLGIIQGYEDGTFRPNNNITRAEFAKIAMSMQGITDSEGLSADFSDIDEDHWASGYIELAKNEGLINGFEDNTFRPNDNVTSNQAVKIIVTMLGREYEAKQHGGYPEGYIYSANQCGILKGVKELGDEPLKRASAARLVYNALDIKIVTMKESPFKQSENENTLRKRLLLNRNSKKIRGTVTATEHTGINGCSETEKGKISIDGVEYDTDLQLLNFLGCRVDAYIDEDDNKILSVREFNNEKWEINAEDICYIDNDEICRYREKNTNREKISLDNPAVIYNGKTTDSIPRIYNGMYELIDNDNDNSAEIVKITERESFIVERVGADNIYFDNDKLFRGRKAFKIMKDDDDYEYTFLNYDGENIALESIEVENSVTIIASLDKTLVTFIVGDKSVEGSVSEIDTSDDNTRITVDNQTFVVRNDAGGNPLADVKVGDSAEFALDENDGIVGIIGDVDNEGKFGYVVNASHDGNFSGKFKLKIVTSGKRKRNVEIVNDSEIISYDFANSECEILEFASKVKMDDVKVDSSSLDKDLFIGNTIKYALNNDGMISKCTLYQLPNKIPAYDFNAKIQSFGGYSDKPTFFADDADILCVPEVADSEDDYYEMVTLTNKGTYNVYPIEIDKQTQKAKAVVISAEMDADSPQPIDGSDDASIVGKVYGKKNSDGEYALCVRVLTGDEIEEIIVDEGSDVYAEASGLKKGDLIRYSLNAFDKMSNLKVLASIQGLNDFYRAYENSPTETVYAMVNTVDVNRISQLRNEMVDKINVVFREDGSGKTVDYELPREDGPVVYRYNRSSGDISSASCDELTSFEEVGSDASRIFLFVNSNDVEIAVIIEE